MWVKVVLAFEENYEKIDEIYLRAKRRMLWNRAAKTSKQWHQVPAHQLLCLADLNTAWCVPQTRQKIQSYQEKRQVLR